jgi:hypothetical protein
LFLASDESRFVTGEAILVDGGISALGPGVFAQDNPVGKAIANSISSGLRAVMRTTGPIGFDPGTT